jgi:hypothetical protein
MSTIHQPSFFDSIVPHIRLLSSVLQVLVGVAADHRTHLAVDEILPRQTHFRLPRCHAAPVIVCHPNLAWCLPLESLMLASWIKLQCTTWVAAGSRATVCA